MSDALRHSLDAARRAVELAATPSPATQREILRQRARALARPACPEEPASGLVEVVEFQLGRERYAFDALCIGEVLPLRPLTLVPGAPPLVRGILNVRGRIVAVLDLKILLDLPRGGMTDHPRIILLRSPATEFGCLADAVIGTRTLRLRDLQPTLPTLTGIRAKYLGGVIDSDLVLLDGFKLLTDRTLVVADASEDHPPITGTAVAGRGADLEGIRP
ncbi:MAG: chemotaxis protein CheW [Lentisphaerae bacterium]|nr:chemotaxis protein CheW [Lentisphaerota bacterium]